jgi:hypothetical protein
VTLRCTNRDASRPMTVRLCEGSHVMGSGTDCTHVDALANEVVENSATISFTCPAPRSASEPGGRYAVYTAPVFAQDGDASVECTPVP